MPSTRPEITVRGDVDQRAIAQLARCAEAGDAVRAALLADGHVGYSQPIGGVIAYPEHVSPSGVGYDIACGVRGTMTDLRVDEVDVPRVMDEIAKRIQFGIGRNERERAEHPVLDRIREAPFAPQRKLYDLAVNQLGTVGGGNHYVDLLADDEGRLWIGVHFGSRGFGYKTANGFLALAQGLPFEGRPTAGEMDAPPVLLHHDSELGQAYVEAMELAGEYAYAGRDVVVERVLDILGARDVHTVHNHHNFAWREEVDGIECWVVRKGCTPAFPGQTGFVGSTMGDTSVVVEGTDATDLINSTIHGAGRVMSRRQAKGRKNRPGLVDWRAVQDRLRKQGIELRGGAADEAPEVYKRLDDVLAAHADTIKVTHRLRPVGVAMAGANVFDPYKD
jgi:tRNA-splicing ligase RtcB